MTANPPTVACPSCGTQSAGKFCAECGAALLGVQCATCRTPLTPGARFCHHCGTPAGASAATASGASAVGRAGGVRASAASDVVAPPPPSRSLLPWGIGLAAMLAVVIAVAVAVQQSEPAPQGMGADIPLGAGAPPFAGGAGAEGGVMRAPDISSMSPRERADRLYDRVMRQASEGKTDSATFFAGMAVQAYELLGPLDDDLKYDYGRMAEMSGNLALAQQQVDAILASNPNHLLGLVLGARVAQLRNDATALTRYRQRLLAAEKGERERKLDEYARHGGDIDAAIAEAKAGK